MNIFDNQLIISSFVEWALAHLFTSFAKVICLDPVKVEYEVQGDEGEQDAAAGFVENLECPAGQLVEKQDCYRLIDKEHDENRV